LIERVQQQLGFAGGDVRPDRIVLRSADRVIEPGPEQIQGAADESRVMGETGELQASLGYDIVGHFEVSPPGDSEVVREQPSL
jgi:hypothetical protein